jgi:spermidine/putrescine-binding protein
VPGGSVDSWASVFEPAAGMNGRVSLLREVTDLIGCALIYLGKSPNSSRGADLAEVVRLLTAAKPRLSKFTTDTYIDELAAGETWLAQGWSGDVFQAQDQNPDVSYVIPREGSLRFVDVMCIPKGAPHPGNAARFMNWVLHPKSAARISKYVSYGTPVSLAKPLLPNEQLSDPAIYPPSSIKLSIVTVTGAKLRKWQAAYDQVVTA